MLNILEGYAYHIKDIFFELVQDDALMSNKENGNYRPHFYCIADEKVNNLFWVVPISSRVDKYKFIVNKKIERYGKCNTIVIGSFGGKENAFLIQNIFPITDKYFDHIHTVNNKPVTVHNELKNKIISNVKDVLSIHKRGIKIVFPNIDEIKRIMLDNLN